MASPPSCAASDEPVVAVPIACFADGACHMPARMAMPSEFKVVNDANHQLYRVPTYSEYE